VIVGDCVDGGGGGGVCSVAYTYLFSRLDHL
jgi:hypothetical protein